MAALKSRERWRLLLHQSVDLIFETDRDGNITLVLPDQLDGQPTEPLLGQNVRTLWPDTDFSRPHKGTLLNPTTFKGLHCMAVLSSSELLDTQGNRTGLRGTLRRLAARIGPEQQLQPPSPPDNSGIGTIQQVIQALRCTIVPRLAVASAMDVLLAALKADGALTDMAAPEKPLHESRPTPANLLTQAPAPSSVLGDQIRFLQTGHLHALLLTENIRSQSPLFLVLWREKPFSSAEAELVRTVCGLLAGFWELDSVHRRLLAGACYDISSNLLNWNGLKEEMERRSRRLDQEQLAATLMVVHVPGLTEIALTHGFMAGEEALRQCIAVLRKAIRPTDVIARLGNNSFGLWLDGGDRFAMAERAERMTAHGAPIIIDPPVHLPLFIGLVSREAGATETPDDLLERATQALQKAQAENRTWCFSHEAP
ncbi:diguanylate cyclase domain-containing protein [Gluconobacter morbifer]|uniref:GGDEF domain-containing protein n=1 Tax=Gluconobacter morbifer G707 TaxID=1088869 RepID=G6XGC5_9PROT|nr:diguanylate cyclase [Gluconobacter morbifer]EHH69233.1 hypothetical protein GMO_05400 [Gluconobacter morbifer G707]